MDSRTAPFSLPERRSNRKVTLAHVIEYALLQSLLGLFRIIGVDAASALAGGFTRTVGPLIGPISRRGEANLKLIYPDMPAAERRRILKGVWENLGRIAGEFAHLEKFTLGGEDGRIELVASEKAREIHERGEPLIFVSGHFANWELMGVALKQAEIPYAFMYRPANNPLVDQMIIRQRARVMTHAQLPKGKRGGLDLIGAMKKRMSVALLVDQKLGDGVAIPFMGHDAMTTPSVARLSLRFNAPIVPASVERLKGARFRVTVHDPIDFSPTGEVVADALALTLLMNEAIAREIRARPDQWLWFHRRWPKDATAGLSAAEAAEA